MASATSGRTQLLTVAIATLLTLFGVLVLSHSWAAGELILSSLSFRNLSNLRQSLLPLNPLLSVRGNSAVVLSVTAQCSSGLSPVNTSKMVRRTRERQEAAAATAAPAEDVQVAGGKVPRRCLWDACKAFTLGMSLLIIGTGVAVVGYFNDQVVTAPNGLEDWNVTNRNGTTTTHLNNLSYVGPIIMGFGGFIIVIACVMTFEARDSAAKIAPSRPKATQETSLTEENVETLERTIRTFQRMESRRSIKVQTPAKGKAQPSSSGVDRPAAPAPQGRRPFSGGLMQLSTTLADRFPSQQSHHWGRRFNDANLSKSPSAPDLWEAIPDALLDELLATGRGGMPLPDRKHGDPSRPLGFHGIGFARLSGDHQGEGRNCYQAVRDCPTAPTAAAATCGRRVTICSAEISWLCQGCAAADPRKNRCWNYDEDPWNEVGKKMSTKRAWSLSAEEQRTPSLTSRRRSSSFSSMGFAPVLRDETPPDAQEFM